MAKNKYVDDYETTVVLDDNGKEKEVAVYHGDIYQVTLSQNELHLIKRRSIYLTAALIVLHVGSGFINNQAMLKFYIALPYVLVFLPLYFLAASVLRLPKEPRNLRRDEVELSIERMKLAGVSALILLGVELAGVIGYLAFDPARERLALDLLFLVFELAAAVSAYTLIHQQRKINIQKIPQGKQSHPQG